MFRRFRISTFAQIKFTVLITVIVLLLSPPLFAADKDDLLNAVQQNKIENVERFLKEGLNLKDVQKYFCAFNELPSYEISKLLLSNGFDLDIFIDQVLLTFYFNHKKQDDEVNYRLIEQRNTLIELMLKNGADADRLLKIAATQYMTKSSNCSGTFYISKQEEVIKLALEYGANFFNIQKDLLQFGNELPSFTASKVMLKNSLNPSIFLKMVLLSSLLESNEEGVYEVSADLTELQYGLIKLALEKGADSKSVRYFYIAPSLEIAKLLLNAGLDANRFYNSVKCFANKTDTPASKVRQKELTDFLLNEGVDLNLAKEQYSEMDDLFTTVGLDQTKLIEHLTKFLSSSLVTIDKNITKLADSFARSEGSCMGLTTVWLYSKWAQYVYPEKNLTYDYDWFKNTKKSIIKWDEEKDLSREEILNFQKFGSLVDFFQSPRLHMDEVGQLDFELVLNSGKLDTNGKTLKRKYSITSIFTLELLVKLLKIMVHDDDWIYVIISGVEHAAGLFKHGNNYYFYDPNEFLGEYKSSSIEEVAKIILTKHEELVALQEKPNGRRFFIDDVEISFPGEKIDAISFVVIGDSDKDSNDYPSQEEFLASANLSIDEDGLIDAIDASFITGCIESLIFFLDQGDALNSKRYNLVYPYIFIFSMYYVSGKSNFAEISRELLKRMDPNKTVNVDIKEKNFEKSTADRLLFLNGKTALHLASYNGYVGMVSAILNDERADINQVNLNDGKTALMYAAERGNTSIVKLLLEKGADRNKKDRNGKTALMLAQESEHISEGLENLLNSEYNLDHCLEVRIFDRHLANPQCSEKLSSVDNR